MSELIKTVKKTSKEPKKKTNWRLVGSLMQGRWWLLLVALVAIVISSLASYISPLIIRMTLDSVLGNEALNLPNWMQSIIDTLGGASYLARNLWICSLALIFLAIINGLGAYIRGRSTAAVSERVAEDLRNRLYDHIQHLSYEYHVQAETGDLLQRCSSDVDMVRRFLGNQLVEIARILISTALGLGIMLSLSVKMTAYSMAMIPLMFIISFVFFRRIQVVFKEAEEAEARLSTTIQESLSGVRVVRAFGQQEQELQKFDRDNGVWQSEVIRINKLMGGFWAVTDLISYVQLAIVTTLCTYFVVKGEFSVGTLVAITTYVQMLLWPLRQLGRILADLSKAGVALGRIDEVLSVPEESQSGTIGTEPLHGDIVFENVSFTYGDGKEVLEDISFTAKEGQTVAILGATGSGKSTMMYLLQRLYEYDSGHITIGGTEITELNRKWLRKNVGMILQEPFLYSRSLRDNIAITKPAASELEVELASRTAALEGVIAEFDQGYSTEVGERGVTLSGGQKQRVAIARTLLQNTPILVFDDSLSAVDTETDQMIRDALAKREDIATTFIISHRITTLAEADLILVVEHGRIVQSGVHEDLIKEEGLYRRVWDIQSEEANAIDFENNGNV